ncbi:MAG TPA: hypothetical protein VM638_00500 [Actinomycetota bacterium]|nr:hypothetical protein [Actinomycetota bacterium]
MAQTLDGATDRIVSRVDSVKLYLASPEGQRLRKALATGLIVSAPIITRLPAFRRSMVGRLIGLAGGAAVIAAAARWLRDWEPELV